MTWDEFNSLDENEKTRIIKEKDTILAFNARLRFILLKEYGLMVLNTTNLDQDRYGKVDIECLHIQTNKHVFIQIKYANINWGDIRISENELTAIKYHKNMSSYQIQMIGDQEYLDLTENVNINCIRICDISFLKDLIDTKRLYPENSSISANHESQYFKMGLEWLRYKNPGNLLFNKKPVAYYMGGKDKNGKFNLVLKSIRSDKEKKCYLIPANLNNYLPEPMIKNFEEDYFSRLPF